MSKKTVALIGLDPFKLDFSNPDYTHFSQLGPDGVRSLLEKDKAALIAAGFAAELIFVSTKIDVARAEASKALLAKSWDCVLIGNGVRSIPTNFLLFEALVNLVIECAPHAKLCFNTRPNDSAEAVQRWITP